MKFKPVFVGIAVIGVLLLVLSLSTVGKILAANPRDLLTGVKSQPLAIKFLPKRSPLFVSFLVNPEKLGLFAQLAAKPSDRSNVNHALDNLKQQLQQNYLLDYDRDIQPWIDKEITLAVTDADLDDQPANGQQAGYLLALATKDVNLAKTTIDAFWQRLAVNGSDLGFEQYLGISILKTSPTDDKPEIAGTILGKFVLFANDAQVLRGVINDLQSPSLTLANLDSYQKRISKLDTGKIGVAYVNLAELGEDLGKESLLASFGLDRSGIRAQTLLALESSDLKPKTDVEKVDSKLSQNKSVKKFSTNIAKFVPLGNSVIVGNNLDLTLQSIKDELSPELQKLLTNAIASLSGNIDIPLDRNAFAWAQDDYAIALLPKTNSNPDWLLVAKVKEAQNSATAISALDDLARNKLTVGEISFKDQPVTVWTKLSAIAKISNSEVSGTVVAAHAQTKNYIYLSNSLSVIESALTLKESQSIASSKVFKTITAKLPSNRQVYGYFDQDSYLNLSKLQPIREFFQNTNSPLASILSHLDTVGFASTANEGNIKNGELFLFLK